MPSKKRKHAVQMARPRVGDLSEIAHSGLRQRVRRDINRLIGRGQVARRKPLIKVITTDPRYVIVHLRSAMPNHQVITRMHHRNKFGMVLVEAVDEHSRTVYIIEQREDVPHPVLGVPGGNIEGDKRRNSPTRDEILYSGLRELEEEAGYESTDNSRFGWGSFGETVKVMVGSIRILTVDHVTPLNGRCRGLDPCVQEVLTDPKLIRRRLAEGVEPANPFVRHLLIRDGILRVRMAKVISNGGYQRWVAERATRERQECRPQLLKKLQPIPCLIPHRTGRRKHA